MNQTETQPSQEHRENSENNEEAEAAASAQSHHATQKTLTLACSKSPRLLSLSGVVTFTDVCAIRQQLRPTSSTPPLTFPLFFCFFFLGWQVETNLTGQKQQKQPSPPSHPPPSERLFLPCGAPVGHRCAGGRGLLDGREADVGAAVQVAGLALRAWTPPTPKLAANGGVPMLASAFAGFFWLF